MIENLRDHLRRQRDERGYAAILVALALIPLLGFAGFAADVGSWHNRAADAQKAADAAALAGVVWLPDTAAATAVAIDAAERNGFKNGTDGVTVTVAPIESEVQQLEVVIIDTEIPMFFSQLFIDDVDITRRSLAEAIPDTPLGNDGQSLGDNLPDGCGDPTDSCAGPGPHAGFWLSINGPETSHQSGDPYATRCLRGSGGNSCDKDNDDYDYNTEDYYVYAIDVPEVAVGSQITVELFDIPYMQRSGINVETGDGGTSSNSKAMDTEVAVYAADGTAFDTPLTTELTGCRAVYEGVADGTNDTVEAAVRATYENRWITHCTFTPTIADVYPLRVRSSGFPEADKDAYGWNAFSIRVNGAGPEQPSLYAIDALSIFSNHTLAAEFKLAKVDDVHAGKELVLELFDAGDGSGTRFTLIPQGPDGPLPDCQYRHFRVGETPSAWIDSDSNTQCEVDTRVAKNSLYNDRWLEVKIKIPDDYSCSTNCWWSILYDISSDATFFERTVWQAQIKGDPVRLLE